MSTREFFQRGPSPIARLFFFCAVSVALIVLDVRYQAAGFIRETLSILIYPLEELVHLPVVLTRNASEFLSAHETLREKNQDLEKKLLENVLGNAERASLQSELNELRNLVNLPPRKEVSSTLAEVHHPGRNPFSGKIVLERGSGQNVIAGSPVMDEKGLIGQVTHVGLTRSEVTLITEENQQVPVKITRNGMRTLSVGDGARNTLSLPFLPEGSDVQVGDQIVTSGIDGVYPEGIPVAQVVRVDRSANQQFAHIVCSPIAGLNAAHYVLIIQNHAEAVKP